MTNFDFLKNEPKFNSFADVAISAEKIFQIDYAASMMNCQITRSRNMKRRSKQKMENFRRVLILRP